MNKLQTISTCLLITTVLTLQPFVVMAEAPEPIDLEYSSQVIITEIQTGSASGSDEFIELYNTSDEAIDISGWQLRYINATSTDAETTLLATVPSEAAILLHPQNYYVFHTASVPLPAGVMGQVYSAKLSSADKSIGLFAPNTETCNLEVQDAIAWGLATYGEGLPTKQTSGAANSEKLLQRYVAPSGGYIDFDHNRQDIAITAATKGIAVPQIAISASPGLPNAQQLPASTTTLTVGELSSMSDTRIADCTEPTDEDEPPLTPPDAAPPSTTEQPEGSDTAEQTPKAVFPARNIGLISPQISELLPNPAKPQTDAADEFVELYNANSVAYELSGYSLEVGKKRYVFPAGLLLQPKSFVAFFSADTKLALSNTAGQVRLVDPLGRLVAQTEAYQSAKDGHAWVHANGSWQWTTAPTPNAANVVKAPVAKSSAKKSSTAAKNAVKGSSLTSASRTNASGDASASSFPKDTSINPLHPGVLALAGGFALLYGAYEYRRDVANKLHQLRTYRASRREHRQGTKGQ